MSDQATAQVVTLDRMIEARAADRPDAIALRFDGRATTYARLAQASAAIAAGLRAQGLTAGDRIVWLGKNHDAIALLAFAAARAGLIFVPLNWRLSQREIAHILADCTPSLLVTDDGFAFPETPLAETPPTLAVDALFDEEAWPGEGLVSPPEGANIGDTAMLIYTSGTTGLPKGVMLSHRSLLGTSTARRHEGAAWDDWGPEDVTIVPVPLAHIGGYGMLIRTLFFGGEVVIQREFDPGEVLRAIDQYKVSKIGLVPAAIRMLLDHPRARETDYSRIRTRFTALRQ